MSCFLESLANSWKKDDHCIVLLAELSFQWITVFFFIITMVGVIILIICKMLTLADVNVTSLSLICA